MINRQRSHNVYWLYCSKNAMGGVYMEEIMSLKGELYPSKEFRITYLGVIPFILWGKWVWGRESDWWPLRSLESVSGVGNVVFAKAHITGLPHVRNLPDISGILQPQAVSGQKFSKCLGKSRCIAGDVGSVIFFQFSSEKAPTYQKPISAQPLVLLLLHLPRRSIHPFSLPSGPEGEC